MPSTDRKHWYSGTRKWQRMLLGLLLCTAVEPSGADNTATTAAVERYFENLLAGRPAEPGEVNSLPAGEVARALKTFRSHVEPRVRYEAYALDFGAAIRNGALHDRRAMVRRLVAALSDADRSVATQALELLMKMTPDDFDGPAKADLADVVNQDPLAQSTKWRIAFLAAIAGADLDLPRLKALYEERRKPGPRVAGPPDMPAPVEAQDKAIQDWEDALWPAQLTLATLGDAEALSHAIATATARKRLNERVLLLRELALTRQAKAINLVVKMLYSDEEQPPDHDICGIVAANEAARILADLVEGFPRRMDSPDEWVEVARLWVKLNRPLVLRGRRDEQTNPKHRPERDRDSESPVTHAE